VRAACVVENAGGATSRKWRLRTVVDTCCLWRAHRKPRVSNWREGGERAKWLSQ
jgi:hypothetical protein